MTGTAVVLALLASVGYGASDVLSGTVVRRHSTASLALWAQLTGLLVLGITVAALRAEAPPTALAWGAGAGALGASGVLSFYTALQRGPTAIVTPVTGAGVVIPVLAGLIAGEPLGMVSGLGVVAAVVGVLVVAASETDDGTGGATPVTWWSRHHPFARPATPGPAQPMPSYDGCVPRREDHSSRSSVVWATAAAVQFGFFFLAIDRATAVADVGADRHDGLRAALAIALAMQLGALAVTLLAATRHTRACLRPGRSLVGPASVVGLLDVGADSAVTVAVGTGSLALVGPLGSLDPVVSVLLATALLGERLRRMQTLGIVVVLLGITLMAAG